MIETEPSYDLVRLINTIWGGRRWIFAGAVIGAVLSGIAADIMRPPVYVANIPVRVWLARPKSDGSDIEAIKAQFSRTALDAYDEFKDHSPRLSKALDDNGMGKDRYLFLQRGGAGDNYVPLHVSSGGAGSTFVIEARMPFSVGNLEIGKELVEALNAHLKRTFESEGPKQIAPVASEPRFQWTKLKAQRLREEAAIQDEIFAMEYELGKRLQELSLRPAADADFVLRAIGALEAEGKLAPDERRTIEERYSKLHAELAVVGLRYESELKALEHLVVESGSSTGAGIATVSDGPPQLVLNNDEFLADIQTGRVERRVSSIAFFSIIGGIIGATSAFSFYLGRRFFQVNRARFGNALVSSI